MSGLSLLKDLSLLSKIVYNIARNYPKDEIYNTVAQMKRAIISVRLNVREGNAFYDKRKISHFRVALGSLVETDECIVIGHEMGWIKDLNEYKEIYYLCLNKLKKLINSINS